jgi:hypothetical protein
VTGSPVDKLADPVDHMFERPNSSSHDLTPARAPKVSHRRSAPADQPTLT